MAVGRNPISGINQHAFLVDNERGTKNCHAFYAIFFSFLPYAIALAEFAADVCQQIQFQAEFINEIYVTGARILAHPDDHGVCFGKLPGKLGKLVCFYSAARCVIFGIKIQNNVFFA